MADLLISDEKKRDENEPNNSLPASNIKEFLDGCQLSHLRIKFKDGDLALLEELDCDHHESFRQFCKELRINSMMDYLGLKAHLRKHKDMKNERKNYYDKMQSHIIPIVGHNDSKTFQDLKRKGKIPTINLVIVGDAQVGKTSLIFRMRGQMPPPNPTRTSKVDNFPIFVEMDHDNGKKIEVMLWDTLGRAEYNTDPNAVVEKAQSIILMYDVTSIQSFESCKRWKKNLDKVAKGIPLALVGNKTDQRRGGNGDISTADGHAYANAIGAPFFEVSNITGDNVAPLLVQRATAGYKAKYPNGFPLTLWERFFW